MMQGFDLDHPVLRDLLSNSDIIVPSSAIVTFRQPGHGRTGMLVLTRRAGESIMIDGRIELKVLRIKGNQVHIGIEAPRETAIHRREVWLRLEGGEEGSAGVEAEDAGASEARLALGGN
jgi:carbon storage regulator